jgi:hypothetical protein
MTITLNSIISGNFDGPISVVGPQGPQGPAGSSGSNGTQGAQGATGISAVIYDGGLANTNFTVGLNINCGGVT